MGVEVTDNSPVVIGFLVYTAGEISTFTTKLKYGVKHTTNPNRSGSRSHTPVVIGFHVYMGNSNSAAVHKVLF